MDKYKYTYIKVGPAIKLKNYILRLAFPSYGCCSNCGAPWNACKPKDVNTDVGRAMFAVCKECWDKMTPEQRIDAYHNLWIRWGKNDRTFKKVKADICKMSNEEEHRPIYNGCLIYPLRRATKDA